MEPSLAAYIRAVMDDEPGLTLTSIARRSGLPLATVSAWANGTRGSARPPAPDSLRRLARGLRRPEHEVFEAAGRTHRDSTTEPDRTARKWASLGRDLTDEDRAVAEAMLRAFRRERGY